MKKEKRLVPELRFPEFIGDWKKKKLGSLTTKVGSGSTPKGGVKVYTKSGIPFIRSQNVFDNQLQLDDVHIPLDIHEKMTNSKVLPYDVLLNITGGSIGRSCVVPANFDEGNVNQHVAIIRLKNENNHHFLQALLSSFRGQKLIYQGMTGSGREGLNFQSIRAFKIAFPDIKEQQKIANFLTAVDTRLQSLEKKKGLLEAYKKGVMQKIFKQEIRFQIENEAGDLVKPPAWEEKKVSDIFTVTRGNVLAMTLVREEQNSEFKYPVYSSQTKNNGLSGYYNEFLYKDAITWTTDGANAGDVNYRKGEFYCTNVCGVLLSNEGYANKFIAERLNSVTKKYVSYVGNPKLMNGVMSEIKIPVPCLAEQTKIANFLSAIDEKINLVSKQIENTEAYKKGLLQRMFV